MASGDPELLVTTDWLAAHLERARPAHPRRQLAHAGRGPRRPRRVRGRAHPRRPLLRHRRDRRRPVDLPHMAPPVEKFVTRMRAMGIGDGHRVVVYDGVGMFSAARVWWLFRLFGKTDVAVLDGGLPKWRAEGRPLEDGAPDPARPPLHRPPRRRPRPRRDPGRRQREARRRPDRRRPRAASGSAARRPSRARACAPATSRARRTCPTASCSTPTAR